MLYPKNLVAVLFFFIRLWFTTSLYISDATQLATQFILVLCHFNKVKNFDHELLNYVCNKIEAAANVLTWSFKSEAIFMAGRNVFSKLIFPLVNLLIHFW